MDYTQTINLLKAENYDILVTVQQYQQRLNQNNQRIAELSQEQARVDAEAAEKATEDSDHPEADNKE